MSDMNKIKNLSNNSGCYIGQNTDIGNKDLFLKDFHEQLEKFKDCHIKIGDLD